MKNIKAILFDLGNVLVKYDLGILEKKCAEYCKGREKKFVEYVAASDNMRKYMKGKLTSSQFYNMTRRIFRMKIKYSEFCGMWNSIFYPYPEMENAVRVIRSKYPELKMVIVSDTNEIHYEFLRKKYPFLDLMDAHVVSHEVGRIKPHSAMFTTALRVSGSLAGETFYTDDRGELIAAARVMGIHAFQFTDHINLEENLAKFGIIIK